MVKLGILGLEQPKVVVGFGLYARDSLGARSS